MYMSWSPSQQVITHTTERRANGMQVAFAESEREGELGVDDDTTPPPTQAPLNSIALFTRSTPPAPSFFIYDHFKLLGNF